MTEGTDTHWFTRPCGWTDGDTSNLLADVNCRECWDAIEREHAEQQAQRQRERDDPNFITIEP